MMFCMLSEALHKFKFDSLFLRFLVSGDFQNEDDNTHPVIESTCRHRIICTTNQWEMSIQMTLNACRVIRVFYHGIIYFKSYLAFPEYLSVSQDKVFDGAEKAEVYWSKIMQVRFDNKYDEEEFHQVEYLETVPLGGRSWRKEIMFIKSIETVLEYPKKRKKVLWRFFISVEKKWFQINTIGFSKTWKLRSNFIYISQVKFVYYKMLFVCERWFCLIVLYYKACDFYMDVQNSRMF